MARNLLLTIDRTLADRARQNAALAVCADTRRAAQRREAAQALVEQRHPARLEAR